MGIITKVMTACRAVRMANWAAVTTLMPRRVRDAITREQRGACAP